MAKYNFAEFLFFHPVFGTLIDNILQNPQFLSYINVIYLNHFSEHKLKNLYQKCKNEGKKHFGSRFFFFEIFEIFEIFIIFATYFSLLWKTAHFRPSESLRGENYILGLAKIKSFTLMLLAASAQCSIG